MMKFSDKRVANGRIELHSLRLTSINTLRLHRDHNYRMCAGWFKLAEHQFISHSPAALTRLPMSNKTPRVDYKWVLKELPIREIEHQACCSQERLIFSVSRSAMADPSLGPNPGISLINKFCNLVSPLP